MWFKVPYLQTLNLIKQSLSYSRQFIFKMLICTSEDSRKYAFRLAASTWCESHSTIDVSCVFYKNSMSFIVLSFINM